VGFKKFFATGVYYRYIIERAVVSCTCFLALAMLAMALHVSVRCSAVVTRDTEVSPPINRPMSTSSLISVSEAPSSLPSTTAANTAASLDNSGRWHTELDCQKMPVNLKRIATSTFSDLIAYMAF